MASEKILTWTKGLEDPKTPLLGPTLKALYLFGLWQTGGRFRTVTYNIIHCLSVLFIVTEFIDLYSVRLDIMVVLNNMSLAGLSIVCIAKCYSYVAWQNQWRELAKMISDEELLQIEKQDRIVIQYMKEYTKYSRMVTYVYWMLVFSTNLFMIVRPFFVYASKTHRENLREGVDPYPQIMCSWFPFDKTKMPGYLGALFVHSAMSTQGSGVLAAYDANAIAILCYLRGQMIILKGKCKGIFDGVTSAQEVIDRIKDCHRHHSVLLKQHKLFGSLLSPTMFQYVLLCSITICCGVIQFSSKEATIAQKLWIVEFTTGLICQLFMYCWHSNEVTTESKDVDRAVYESQWWRGDVRVRKQLLLLAGKLNHTLVLKAGPYSALSVAMFIDILKGSYSFYTLFSQMHDDK